MYRSVKIKDDRASIICQANNDSSTIQSIAVLYVYPKVNATHPIITDEPEDVTANIGTDVSFKCTSFGKSFQTLIIVQKIYIIDRFIYLN